VPTSSYISRVKTFVHSGSGRTYIRFACVSATTTLISFSVITILYGTRLIPSEVAATITGNLAAAVPAYFLTRRWAWKKSGRSHLTKEVLPFAAMSFLGLVVSTIGAAIAHHVVHTHHWSHLTNTATVSGTNLVSFALVWVLKIAVFNRVFKRSTVSVTPETSSVQ
jgi:putative flippase GtrA